MADDLPPVDGEPRDEVGDEANTSHVRAATQDELESDLARYGRSSGTRPHTFATPVDEIRVRITNLCVFWELCDNSRGAMTPDYVRDVDQIRNLYRAKIGTPPSVEWIDKKIRAEKDQALDALDKVKHSLDQAAPPSEPPPPESTATPLAAEQYVTLDQMAALVNRGKKTLERKANAKNSDMPAPDVEGGGGKPHEWKWSAVRPWLEKQFKRQLPERFPR